jgi:hypothetical protein
MTTYIQTNEFLNTLLISETPMLFVDCCDVNKEVNDKLMEALSSDKLWSDLPEEIRVECMKDYHRSLASEILDRNLEKSLPPPPPKKTRKRAAPKTPASDH